MYATDSFKALARVEAETRAEMHTRLAEHRDAVEVLKLRLSEVTGERDRARSVAVALEGELERLRAGIEVPSAATGTPPATPHAPPEPPPTA